MLLSLLKQPLKIYKSRFLFIIHSTLVKILFSLFFSYTVNRAESMFLCYSLSWSFSFFFFLPTWSYSFPGFILFSFGIRLSSLWNRINHFTFLLILCHYVGQHNESQSHKATHTIRKSSFRRKKGKESSENTQVFNFSLPFVILCLGLVDVETHRFPIIILSTLSWETPH